MGQIATMLTSVTRTRSPLQKELDSLTKVLGIIAWTAVAFIVVVGVLRGMEVSELLLLGTAMAISAIPTGLPAFVSGLLSVRRQAARRGQGRREEPHRRRDPRRHERDQHRQDRHADDEPDDGVDHLPGEQWFTVEGEGYRKSGAILSVAGAPVPDFTRLALGLVLDSDATVADDGAVVGDPTEAALVVLAAKLRGRRRGDPPGLPAPRGGAVRLRVQVHGHLPPRSRSTASTG